MNISVFKLSHSMLHLLASSKLTKKIKKETVEEEDPCEAHKIHLTS